MTTVGIIAEYNPFHNGHAYQINKAKELTGADNVIVLMSGNYVQRGTPAIFNKYIRAKHALLNDVSLVLELPVCYATASAELFAEASITTFNKLGIIDYISFGCEWDNLSQLQTIATILANEPDEYKSALKLHLAQGSDFPTARKKALSEILTDISLADILDTPNNILAIEYLKALIRTKSSIKPIPIKRTGEGYHSTVTNSEYASATAIRECTYKNDLSIIKKLIPENTLPFFNMSKYLHANDFSASLAYKLIYENNYNEYYDISEFLSNRINNQKKSFTNYITFANELLTKNETSTHINRSLLHILLDIKQLTIDEFKEHGLIFYAYPLATNLNHTHLLKSIKEHSEIPLIERFGDFYKHQTSHCKEMLDINLKADKLYNSVYYIKTGCILPDDFTISAKEKSI